MLTSAVAGLSASIHSAGNQRGFRQAAQAGQGQSSGAVRDGSAPAPEQYAWGSYGCCQTIGWRQRRVSGTAATTTMHDAGVRFGQVRVRRRNHRQVAGSMRDTEASAVNCLIFRLSSLSLQQSPRAAVPVGHQSQHPAPDLAVPVLRRQIACRLDPIDLWHSMALCNRKSVV